MKIDVSVGGGQEEQVHRGVYLCRIKGIRTATNKQKNLQVVIDADVNHVPGTQQSIHQSWYIVFQREDGSKVKYGCETLQSLGAACGCQPASQLDSELVAKAVVKVALEYEPASGQYAARNKPLVFGPRNQDLEMPEPEEGNGAGFMDGPADPGDDADLDNGGF